jgi:hypothetical protein
MEAEERIDQVLEAILGLGNPGTQTAADQRLLASWTTKEQMRLLVAGLEGF